LHFHFTKGEPLINNKLATAVSKSYSDVFPFPVNVFTFILLTLYEWDAVSWGERQKRWNVTCSTVCIWRVAVTGDDDDDDDDGDGDDKVKL